MVGAPNTYMQCPITYLNFNGITEWMDGRVNDCMSSDRSAAIFNLENHNYLLYKGRHTDGWPTAFCLHFLYIISWASMLRKVWGGS